MKIVEMHVLGMFKMAAREFFYCKFLHDVPKKKHLNIKLKRLNYKDWNFLIRKHTILLTFLNKKKCNVLQFFHREY